MKKGILSLLVLCMLMMVVPASLAEEVALEDMGITFQVPEGMTVTRQDDETGYGVIMQVEGREDIVYTLVSGYYEEYAGRSLDELTEEELYDLQVEIDGLFEEAVIDVVSADDDLTLLEVYDATGMHIHYFTIINGWYMDLAAAKISGPLTDNEINVCIDILLTMQTTA